MNQECSFQSSSGQLSDDLMQKKMTYFVPEEGLAFEQSVLVTMVSYCGWPVMR